MVSLDKPVAVALKALTALYVDISERADKLREAGNLNGLVKLMDEVHTLNELLGKIKAGGEAVYDRVRFSHIPDVMDEEGTTKIGVDGVGLCYLTSYFDVKQEDKEALRAWLLEQHLEDMINESVNAQTLQAFVNRRMKEAAEAKTVPNLPMAALKLTPRTRAAIKSDGKSKQEQ